ncbi:MAG: DinB family protein [Planctomycetota bacterium]|nr:DinB family protein [Planctomycetota bacterium]
MKAIDVVKMALQSSDEFCTSLVQDMRDAPLTQPTARGGNHPLWVMGHMAHTEGELAHVITGEPNPVAEWKDLFGAGSQPTADAKNYPSIDEVLNKYRELRALNLKMLDKIGDDGLDQSPRAVPKGMEHIFPTIGKAYLAIAMHQMSHAGQVTVARRAAGRKLLVG